jgi:glycosyltransferase involved in cell wall biosynthesis
MPLISLVMPARNADATLAEALNSLAQQSFTDFEVVLVNDGSTDATQVIAESYGDRLRLRVLVHETGQGVAQSINDGLGVGDSEFVARLDADDIAQPGRLQRQLDFLLANVGIGVCGSDMHVFSPESDQRYLLAHPTSNVGIRTALLQRCAISHPSVMCRRSIFEQIGLYDPRFDFAEDYELWCRASLLGIQFANIPEPLTLYRSHPGQVGRQKAQLQYERDMAIKGRYMTAMLQGEDAGLLPQFLALQTKFTSREIAMTVLQQCGGSMLSLAKTVPDSAEYARIVTGSLIRHLS